MLTTYDLKKFSSKIKILRKSLGFTIYDVSTSTGISQGTIKHIEAGKSIPRFDTLHILSSFYKCDLLSIFKEDLYDSMTIFLFNSISTFAAKNDTSELDKTLISISAHLSNKELTPVEYRDLTQLRLFVEGLLLASRCHNSTCLEIELAIEKYENALSITNPLFSFNNFDNFKYFSIEFNILFSAAVVLGIKRDCLLSNRILYFILEYYQLLKYSFKTNNLLISKLYYVLSYNYHRLDNHEKALEISVIGLNHCINLDTHMYIPLLLGRKAIALHNLQSSEWQKPLTSAIILLDIQGSKELKKSFEDLLKSLDCSFKV